ncbi:MAG: hypothetical protein FJ096_18105 [Deltaproteobacteria bacterium]|nr:hypothetical protein [Deltaproteobacteria bacterium]
MPTPFLSSVSGRILLAAFASFTLSAAAYLVAGNLTIFGIGFPLGLTLSFVGVGLGMSEYTSQTMLSVLVLPPALWGFIYLTGEFKYRSANSWGYGLALLGVIALAKAAMGGSDTPEPSATAKH